MFSWTWTLGLLVPTEHRLHATAYLSAADHVRAFMTTMYPSSRITNHVTRLKSAGFNMAILKETATV